MALSADIIWNGGEGSWSTVAEWTPAQVPDIGGGKDTATIGAGVVTYTPGADWSNNSVVTITNNARWTQSGGTQWIRAAGNGSGKSGTLVLKDSAEFHSGSAGRVVIGIAGGDGVLQVNDNARLYSTNTLFSLAHDANSSGVIDLNGGTVKTYSLAFQFGAPSTAPNTSARLNISGGTADIGEFVFYHTEMPGFDQAINFDGEGGKILKYGVIKFRNDGVDSTNTWEELYAGGKLLRHGSNTGEFEYHFNLNRHDWSKSSDELSVRTPITWNGTTGSWYTAANWVGGVVPDIKAGANSVIINSGTVQYAPSVPGGDWINNSYVIFSNDAQWVQTSGVEWIRIAGDRPRNKGTLILNDSSKFSAGTAGRVALGVNRNTGTVVVNDSAVLDAGGKILLLAFKYDTVPDFTTSGTLDLNSGRVEADRLCFSFDTSEKTNAIYGAKTHGRVFISGGTIECTSIYSSILFANTHAAEYDHAIDFDGDAGEIITRGVLEIESDTNIKETQSWEQLFNSGYLLRNGSNTGIFSDIFVVKDLANGKRSLRLRSHQGTTIVVR